MDMESFGMEVLSVKSPNTNGVDFDKKLKLIREQCADSDIIITASFNGKSKTILLFQKKWK